MNIKQTVKNAALVVAATAIMGGSMVIARPSALDQLEDMVVKLIAIVMDIDERVTALEERGAVIPNSTMRYAKPPILFPGGNRI